MDANQHENWSGKYANTFDAQVATPPEQVWTDIETELFENKKKPIGIYYWVSGIAAVFLLGIMLFHVQQPIQWTSDVTYAFNDLNNYDSISDLAETPEPQNQRSLTQRNNSQQLNQRPVQVQPEVSPSINPPLIVSNELDPLPTKEISTIPEFNSEILCSASTFPEINKTPEPISKWAFSGNFVVGKNMRLISSGFDQDKSIGGEKSDRLVPLTMAQFNGLAHYKLGDKWELSSGISYAKAASYSRWRQRPAHFDPGEDELRFQSSEGPIRIQDEGISNALNNGDTLDLKMRSRQSASFLSLPVTIDRKWTKNRWSTSLRAGVSLDFQLQSEIHIEVEIDDEIRPLDTQIDISKTQPSLQGILGAELRYQVAPSFSILAHTKLSAPLSPYVKTDNFEAASAYFGVGLGLRYDLQ